MESSVLFSYISFPNYAPTLRSHDVVYRGKYTSFDDVTRMLSKLKFQDNRIRDLQSGFHESGYLIEALRTVRACIIQIKPSHCNVDKICVLENTDIPLSERVIYIRMYDYSGGKRTKCGDVKIAVIMFVLGLFALVGIALSLSHILEMLISTSSHQ